MERSELGHRLAAGLPSLQRLARTVCAGRPADADDLVQATCLCALRYSRSYVEGNFRGWLATIMAAPNAPTWPRRRPATSSNSRRASWRPRHCGPVIANPEVVATGEGHADAPKLAVDSQGNLHLVYGETPTDAFSGIVSATLAAPQESLDSMNYLLR